MQKPPDSCSAAGQDKQQHWKSAPTNVPLTDPSNPHFSALFAGTVSPGLTAGGTSVGEGLLSAQSAEHHCSKHAPPISFPVKQQN